MKSLGNFQDLAVHYGNARQGFDARVFEQVGLAVGGFRGIHALDMGCGTGISTRGLVLGGAHVTGCDPSSAMLDEARQSGDGVEYILAKADALPFDADVFDLVTAFSAFHWFSDDASVAEILRVLKKNAVFAVVNKNDVSGIRKDVVRFFKKYITEPTGKEVYVPEDIVTRHFTSVSVHVFHSEETFGLEDGIEYLRSIALWNLVPKSEQEIVLDAVRAYFTQQYDQNGMLRRDIDTVVIVGRKL